MRPLSRPIGFAIACWALLAVGFSVSSVQAAELGRWTVLIDQSRPLDGDTVWVSGLEGGDIKIPAIKLRFRGFDTPEGGRRSRHPCPSLSWQATELLWTVLQDGQTEADKIRLILDRHSRDHFGRLLARARLPDGRLLTDAMLATGEPRGLVRRYFRGASQTPWPGCH